MESFKYGDRVFAKVRGYPPWPARVDGITEVQGKNRFHVFFYGTYEVWVTQLSNKIRKKDWIRHSFCYKISVLRSVSV